MMCFTLSIQTPTAGQRWRSLSSLSPERGTPSSLWRQQVPTVSQRRMKTWIWTPAPSANRCWCLEAETTRAIFTPTWRLSVWGSCSLLFKESESEVNPHFLTGCEAISTTTFIIYIPTVCVLFFCGMSLFFFCLLKYLCLEDLRSSCVYFGYFLECRFSKFQPYFSCSANWY